MQSKNIYAIFLGRARAEVERKRNNSGQTRKLWLGQYCHMEELHNGDLKRFLEELLNKIETTICEDHSTTSELLLHSDLLEKSIEVLRVARETNANRSIGSQVHSGASLMPLSACLRHRLTFYPF